MGDSLYGHNTSDGKLIKTLKLQQGQTQYIQQYLDTKGKDTFQMKATHSVYVDFMLKEMTRQVLNTMFRRLQNSAFMCLIADEWSCMLSSKEYVSVSIQYSTDALEVDTVFLGFFHLCNTTGSEVASGIMKALQQSSIPIQLDKIVAQTYDGAVNMQGTTKGAHAYLRRNHLHFGLPHHCFNHQTQLEIKKETKKEH